MNEKAKNQKKRNNNNVVVKRSNHSFFLVASIIVVVSIIAYNWIMPHKPLPDKAVPREAVPHEPEPAPRLEPEPVPLEPEPVPYVEPIPPGIKTLRGDELSPNDIDIPIYSYDPYENHDSGVGQGNHSSTYVVCNLKCLPDSKLFIRKNLGKQTSYLKDRERKAKKEIYIYKLLSQENITPKLYDYFIYDGQHTLIIEKMNYFEINDGYSDFLEISNKLEIMFNYGIIHNDCSKKDNYVRDDNGDILFIDFGESIIRGKETEEEWNIEKQDQRRKLSLFMAKSLKCATGRTLAERQQSDEQNYIRKENKRKRIAEKKGIPYIVTPFEETEEYKDTRDVNCANIYPKLYFPKVNIRGEIVG